MKTYTNRQEYLIDMNEAITRFDGYKQGMEVIDTVSGIAIELNGDVLVGNDVNHLIADAHNYLGYEKDN